MRNRIDDTVGDLQEATPEEARKLAKDIMKQYKDALVDAETNYPDEWVTLADLRKYLPGGNDSTDGSGTDGTSSKPTGPKAEKTNPHHTGPQDTTHDNKADPDPKLVPGAPETEAPKASATEKL